LVVSKSEERESKTRFVSFRPPHHSSTRKHRARTRTRTTEKAKPEEIVI
jgi:hypothetical protein